MAKDVMDHLADFWEGSKSLHKGAHGFGDYLARIGGFRDWQEAKDSVMYDGTVLYIEQAKAKQETKLFIEAVKKTPDLYPLYLDALEKDAKEKPAYYAGSVLSGFAIGKVISNTYVALAFTGVKASGLGADTIHEVIGELGKQLGISEEELLKLMENGNLKDSIQKELDKMHYEDGILYVTNKDEKGYKLENGEWKDFDNNKEKLFENGHRKLSVETILADNVIACARQQLDTDILSGDLKEKLLLTQNTFGMSDKEFENCISTMASTDKDFQKFMESLKTQEEQKSASKCEFNVNMAKQ